MGEFALDVFAQVVDHLLEYRSEARVVVRSGVPLVVLGVLGDPGVECADLWRREAVSLHVTHLLVQPVLAFFKPDGLHLLECPDHLTAAPMNRVGEAFCVWLVVNGFDNRAADFPIELLDCIRVDDVALCIDGREPPSWCRAGWCRWPSGCRRWRRRWRNGSGRSCGAAGRS